jgi:uncharacterized phage-associated protein
MSLEKLVQATGYLLKKYDDRRLNYTKLIKELYLADREAFAEKNSSITGDTYVSMKHGPVLSRLYDLIKGKCQDKNTQNYWDTRFTTDGQDLMANFDQYPDGNLSIADEEILDMIDGKFHHKSYGQMIDYVHENCKEWHNPGNTSVSLKIEDILAAIGKTQEEIDWILEENHAFEVEDKLFKSLATEV